jgi:hypothetical protein
MHRFMFCKESLLILFCFNSMKYVIKWDIGGHFEFSIIIFSLRMPKWHTADFQSCTLLRTWNINKTKYLRYWTVRVQFSKTSLCFFQHRFGMCNFPYFSLTHGSLWAIQLFFFAPFTIIILTKLKLHCLIKDN